MSEPVTKDRQSILLENMPRDLIAKLKAKCALEEPKTSMRAVIERLIRRYLNA